jgi:hypothetical protein
MTVAAAKLRWRRWFAVAALCALAVSATYHSAFRQGVNLPEALYGFGLVVVAAAALLARWRLGLSFFAAFSAALAGAPVAVILKVLIDVIRDPTSHNLWPIEVVIAMGVGLVPAALGALAGWGMAKALPPTSQS